MLIKLFKWQANVGKPQYAAGYTQTTHIEDIQNCSCNCRAFVTSVIINPILPMQLILLLQKQCQKHLIISNRH